MPAVIGHQGAIPIIGVRCQYCSRFVHPAEVIRFGDGMIQCFQCREKDVVAIEGFVPPRECGLCRRGFGELAAIEKTEHVKMFPHWIDGVYVLLCQRCDLEHTRKRKDLYRGTRFGWEQKI
jgi:hypothetical protein